MLLTSTNTPFILMLVSISLHNPLLYHPEKADRAEKDTPLSLLLVGQQWTTIPSQITHAQRDKSTITSSNKHDEKKVMITRKVCFSFTKRSKAADESQQQNSIKRQKIFKIIVIHIEKRSRRKRQSTALSRLPTFVVASSLSFQPHYPMPPDRPNDDCFPSFPLILFLPLSQVSKLSPAQV